MRYADYLKSKNMWENTILIFSTDNGGETNAGGNNWPLRGKKWTLWEGGVRGVSFIHSPLFNSTTVGTTHRSLMHISDWYPTILEGILSHTLPSNLSLDGVNMWSSLLAGSEGPRTELLHTIDPLASHPGVALYNDTFPTNTTAAIRVGDWKLLTGYPGVDKIFPPVNYYSDYFNYRVSNWHWKTLNKIARIKGDEANYFHLMHDNEYHDLQDRHMQGVLYENDFPEIYQLTASGEVKNVWLFNITEDPEELIDRSDDFPEIVKQLLDRLAEYNLTAIPPNFPSPDPAGSPANNGGAWKPWVNTGVVSTLINHVNSAIVRTKSFFGQLISWE
ncbi:hypothetical protein EB796_014664 [Bugula neritina]|uniref:Sulfatase N-terminal domain-containing protein n=1 Tax=Bugula neritina TaxID=10212 RepID=A0A7J7JMC7_BUGNE|nr:hypothetical protein EB796_014664 [Bugula neritina]